jgi:hypothetical protein
MYYPSTDIARRVMQERVKDCVGRADRRQMLRQAGISERPWFIRLACPGLIRLGDLLVEAGRRLQAYGAPQIARGVSGQSMRSSTLS